MLSIAHLTIVSFFQRSSMPSSGKLLENLLDPDPNLKPTQVNLLPLSEYQDQEYTLDTENRAIQLLLGR